MNGRARTPEEIAAVIERLGALQLRNDGVALVYPDYTTLRLDGPLVRSLVIEESWKAMPSFAVGKAIELLADRALDVRTPPSEVE